MLTEQNIDYMYYFNYVYPLCQVSLYSVSLLQMSWCQLLNSEWIEFRSLNNWDLGTIF
jgi:hypothetical protein